MTPKKGKLQAKAWYNIIIYLKEQIMCVCFLDSNTSLPRPSSHTPLTISERSIMQ